MSEIAPSGRITSAMPRLARLARATRAPRHDQPEQCELCASTIAPRHRHLLDIERSRLLCACPACAVLFDRAEAGGRRYRLVPDRVRFIHDFDLDAGRWASFRIPVDLAFFFRTSTQGRVAAFYPGPLGATESLLDLEAWDDLVRANPVVSTMEDDVEALLVDRTGNASRAWLVPVDRCYELVGLIRMKWKGLAGGSEVWNALDTWFAELGRRAWQVSRNT